MNLYYAMGGGLGHLTRARAFLQTIEIDHNSVIVTSSSFAQDTRVTGNIPVCKIENNFEKDISAFQDFLLKTFIELNIKTIYLDSFPVGIIGEFDRFDFQNIEVNYVARLLRWNKYSLLIKKKSQRFGKTFILEQLENEHQNFVENFSNQLIKIELNYPTSELSDEDNKIFQYILQTQKPFWLIVHSGEESELLELVNYADEMRDIEKVQVNLILISPTEIKYDNLFQCNIYPASILFNYADRIFTACGFNIMNQLKNLKDKHYFIPFERRYDKQSDRAKHFRDIYYP